MSNFNRLIVDYAAMSGPEFLEAVGVDAKKWTDAFVQLHGDKLVEHNLLLGWFANAMMAMHDHLYGNPPLNGDHVEYIWKKGEEQ